MVVGESIVIGSHINIEAGNNDNRGVINRAFVGFSVYCEISKAVVIVIGAQGHCACRVFVIFVGSTLNLNLVILTAVGDRSAVNSACSVSISANQCNIICGCAGLGFRVNECDFNICITCNPVGTPAISRLSVDNVEHLAGSKGTHSSCFAAA